MADTGSIPRALAAKLNGKVPSTSSKVTADTRSGSSSDSNNSHSPDNSSSSLGNSTQDYSACVGYETLSASSRMEQEDILAKQRGQRPSRRSLQEVAVARTSSRRLLEERIEKRRRESSTRSLMSASMSMRSGGDETAASSIDALAQMEQDIRSGRILQQQSSSSSLLMKPGAVAVAGLGSSSMGSGSVRRTLGQLEEDAMSKQKAARAPMGRPGAVAVSGDDSLARMETDLLVKEQSLVGSGATKPGAQAVSGSDAVHRFERTVIDKELQMGGSGRVVAARGGGGLAQHLQQQVQQRAQQHSRPGAMSVSSCDDSLSQMESDLLIKEQSSVGGGSTSTRSKPGAQAVSGSGTVDQFERTVIHKEMQMGGSSVGSDSVRRGLGDSSMGGESFRRTVGQLEADALSKQRAARGGGGGGASVTSRPGAVSVDVDDALSQMESDILVKGQPGQHQGALLPGAQAVSGNGIERFERTVINKELGGGSLTIGTNHSVRDRRPLGGSVHSVRSTASTRSAVALAKLEDEVAVRAPPTSRDLGRNSSFRGSDSSVASANVRRSVTQLEDDLVAKGMAQPNSSAASARSSDGSYPRVSFGASSKNNSTDDLSAVVESDDHSRSTATTARTMSVGGDRHQQQQHRMVMSRACRSAPQPPATETKEFATRPAPRLVEARAVQDVEEVPPEIEGLETAHAEGEVDLEEQLRQQLRREEARRKRSEWKCKVWVGFVLVLLAVFVATFFAVGSNKSSDDAAATTSSIPSGPVDTAVPTQAPTSYVIDLPDYTLEKIARDPFSPQARAYRWIENDPYLEQYEGQEFRLVQRFALATLYYALDGDNWYLRNGWMDYEKSECDWAFKGGYGLPAMEMRGLVETQLVYMIVGGALTGDAFDWSEFLYTPDRLTFPPAPICNPQNEFKLLKIHKQNVNGAIPEELALISSLALMDISYNEGLIGSLPTTFGTMKKMKYIMMEETAITGTIPSEMGAMECMRALSTSGTRFSPGTTIPTEFGNLKELTTMLLAFSGIEGSIPSELGRLAGNLTIFDASSLPNQEDPIRGPIASELGLLTNLHVFSCGNCQLEGTLPNQLGALRELELLSIGPSDGLVGTIPTSLGGLTSLKYARLAESRLTGRIPSELGSATDLVRMYLLENQLSGSLPSELGRLRMLESVSVNGNEGLTGTIPSQLVSGWRNSLVALNISDTMITGTMPREFCLLPGFFEFECSSLSCGCNCPCAAP